MAQILCTSTKCISTLIDTHFGLLYRQSCQPELVIRDNRSNKSVCPAGWNTVHPGVVSFAICWAVSGKWHTYMHQVQPKNKNTSTKIRGSIKFLRWHNYTSLNSWVSAHRVVKGRAYGGHLQPSAFWSKRQLLQLTKNSSQQGFHYVVIFFL